MIPGYIFLAAGDLERTELKKHEKEFVQIELIREKSEEEKLIQELNALRQFEILAQTEEVLVNPGIKHGDKVLVLACSASVLILRGNGECEPQYQRARK